MKVLIATDAWHPAALTLSREACRAFALERSWEASAQAFMRNVMSAALDGGHSPRVAAPA